MGLAARAAARASASCSLRDYLANTIKDPDEIERYLHLDLLAAVPRYDEDNVHLVTEAYQNLRTALLFARKDERGQVVLVTGTAPQEGKTTTLVNIAKLLAASGERTIVLDFDLRRAQLHQRLGLPARARASPTTSCATRTCDALIQPTRVPEPLRADRGPAAAEPARPARAQERWPTCSTTCAAHFDWILVDSPPLASVTDALLLARHADIAVMVVQHNKVDKKLVKRSVAALRRVTPNLLGAVLNAVDVQGAELPLLLLPAPRSPRRRRGQAARREGRAGRNGAGAERMSRGAAPALAALLTLAAAAAHAQAPAPTPRPTPRPRGAGIGIGTLAWIDRELERAELPNKSSWERLREGAPLRTGDSFRTAPDATARLEFPWMAVTLGGGAMLTIPASSVLSTVLEQGRAEFAGPGREIVKIKVGDGEVRGGGRLVLRRSAGRTTATALEGSFRVRAAGRTVEIKAGQATVVADGRPPEAASPLPKSPSALEPGKDPVYVRSGRPAQLTWSAASPGHRVEVLALDRDHVLLARDVTAPPLFLELPWLGTYRWRVAATRAAWRADRPTLA